MDALKAGQKVLYHDGHKTVEATVVGESVLPKVIDGVRHQPPGRMFGNTEFPAPYYDVRLADGSLVEWVPQATEDMATPELSLGGVVMAAEPAPAEPEPEPEPEPAKE